MIIHGKCTGKQNFYINYSGKERVTGEIPTATFGSVIELIWEQKYCLRDIPDCLVVIHYPKRLYKMPIS